MQLTPLMQYRSVLCIMGQYTLLYCIATVLFLHCWGGEWGMESGSQSYLRLFVSYSLRLCSIL